MKKNGFKAYYFTILLVWYAVIFCSSSFFAQKNEVDFRAISISNYPEVKGNLWVRAPAGIKTDGLQFYEDEKPVKVKFEASKKSDSIAKNKVVLFLLRNTSANSTMKWYKDVLTNAFKNAAIKPGDQIEILGFSSLLTKEISVSTKLTFTDNLQVLLDKIDRIEAFRRVNFDERIQTHTAINEALAVLEAQNLKFPAGIFVLSDDRKIASVVTGEPLVTRSRRLNIPVYGVTYNIRNDYYDIKELCDQTYGEYVSESSNDINVVSNAVSAYLIDFINRHAGLSYPFKYTTSFKKDGQNHDVKLDIKNRSSGFTLAVPSKKMNELIGDNLLLIGIILIALVILIIVVSLLYKKNKVKKQNLEIERNKQLLEMESLQKVADQKLTQQEIELRNIKEEEHKQAAAKLDEKLAQEQAKEDQIQLQKMLERGNLPWFEFRYGKESGNYQIQSPLLTVGRDKSNSWSINHSTISRIHFQLVFKNYVYTILDLGSSNGVFVNDIKVSECELKHGDSIQVGEITLTFHI